MRPTRSLYQATRAVNVGPSRLASSNARRTWTPYLVGLTIATGAIYFAKLDRKSVCRDPLSRIAKLMDCRSRSLSAR